MAKRSVILRKVWAHRKQTVRATGNVDDDYRALMFALKSGFTTPGFPHPWVVALSSDSVSAGAADHWLTAANLIWVGAAGAHSWIVLTQPVLGVQLCIDLIGAGSNWNARLYFSQTGAFAGGDTSNRPTAPDEYTITTSAWADSNFQQNRVMAHVNFLQSTDGKSTRYYFSSARGVHYGGVMLIDELTESREPAPVALFHVAGIDVLNASALTLTTNVRVVQNGTLLLCRYSTEGYYQSTLPQPNAPSDFDGFFDASPLAVISTQFPLRERLGVVPDLWILGGPQVAGDFVGDDNRRVITLNPLVVPWDGSAVRPLE